MLMCVINFWFVIEYVFILNFFIFKIMYIWKKNEIVCIFINYVVFCFVYVYFRIKKFKNLFEILIFGIFVNY